MNHSPSNTLPLPKDAIEQVRAYLVHLQTHICERLSDLDQDQQFKPDTWERPAGGGGVSCILENGRVFEKAGVNFSEVFGEQLPRSASASRSELAGASFHAMGVSLVIRPHNPFVPTSHANVRFFMALKNNQVVAWWFGGGFDLTPYYGFESDCVHWHQVARQACQPYGDALYPKFKKWCDDYFYLKHRQEARGIGGLFFDDYAEHSFEHSFDLMKSIGSAYIEAYAPIVEKRMNCAFDEHHKSFQKYRRGRYVEFNLIYDRGTLFGLQSGGRTESILMSLPPEVEWKYQWAPKPGTAESKLYTDFLPAKAWLD